MKKIAFFVVIVSVLVFGFNLKLANATNVGVSASTSTTVVWPDYHMQPWNLAKQVLMIKSISHTLNGNDYVVGPGKYDVIIGTASVYFDSVNLEQVKTGIMEMDILGNGPVFRLMSVFGRDGGMVIDSQVRVDGKWTSMPLGSSWFITVIDEDSVISKNTMAGIILTVKNADGEVFMNLKLDNKNKKR